MQQYQDNVVNQNGAAIPGASVTVTTLAGGVPTLYAGNGTGQLASNVLTTDSLCHFSFMRLIC